MEIGAMYKITRLGEAHPNLGSNYNKEAELTQEPRVGFHFIFGSLITTPVTELTGEGFKTKNSEYILNKI